MIVDAHCWLGPGILASQSEAGLLRSMDRHGIAMAVVSPSDRGLVVGNREANRAVARAVARHPDRLLGYAAVNPWLGVRATEELDRARGLGMRGLFLHPRIQGLRPLDPHVMELSDHAGRIGMPVHVATGSLVSGHPLALAELARQLPHVRFVLGSGGHSDLWLDVIPAMRWATNLWLEVSYKATHVIREYVDTLGADRVLFGSDAPLNDQGLELTKLRNAGLEPEAFRAVAGENLRRLVDGPPPPAAHVPTSGGGA